MSKSSRSGGKAKKTEASADNEPEPILNRWSQAISRLLWESASVSSSITSHPLLLGDSRETFIRDVLSKICPPNVYIGTGVIVDRRGQQSNQIDIIIYRSDFPIFRTLGTADVFMFDGVLATIEVKSTLTATTLLDALRNCYSVSSLHLHLTDSFHDYAKAHFDSDWDDLPQYSREWLFARILPPSYVFGHFGYRNKFDTFVSALNSGISKLEDGDQPPLSRLPAVIAAENAVAITNRRGFFDYQCGDKKWGYLAARTCREGRPGHPSSLTFLLAHLLNTILEATPARVHQLTGVTYGVQGWVRPPKASLAWAQVGDYNIVDVEDLGGSRQRRSRSPT